MSFHFVSHPWQVQEMDDGILVKVSAQDLDGPTVSILVDELSDLSLAEGRPNIYLDFQEVRFIPNALIGELVALDEKLRQVGGRLVLQDVGPMIVESLQAAGVAELLGVTANGV